MPSGDEGTGLHAFDDLDPISTVSALNAAPPELEPPAVGGIEPALRGGAMSETPGAIPRSAAPPPRRFNTLPMPPLPRGGVGGRSVPPPPPSRSRPEETAPPAVILEDEPLAQGDDEADADGDTRVVPNEYLHDAPTASFARPGDDDGSQFEELDANSASTGLAPVPDRAGMDDSELLELSATTVATNIDMDWDEEDVQTKIRDEERDSDGASGAQAATPFVSGRPSPFPPPYPGNPSPFAAPGPAPFAGSRADEWEAEEEALTRVMSTHTLPAPPSVPSGWRQHRADSLTPASNAETLLGHDRDAARTRLTWVGAGAIALIGVAFGMRALISSSEPGTVTIVTKPSDVEVLVDGRPFAGGQSSPFTIQELAPDEEHMIVVRKPGFAEQTHHFSLDAGEVKQLPTIELAPLRVDTGFALSSVPEGAQIFVDDQKLGSTTPARVTDLKPGLHVIRLERGEGYQPWETQVALASGQVIELPTARLVGGGVARPERSPTGSSAAKSSSAGSSGSRERTRTQERRERTPQRQTVAAAPAPMPQMAPMNPMAGPRPGGASGSLRINSRPWSQVFVDGRMVGNTPQLNIPLSSGSHNVKLVNPQLGMSKNLKVRIQNGKVTTKIVELME